MKRAFTDWWKHRKAFMVQLSEVRSALQLICTSKAYHLKLKIFLLLVRQIIIVIFLWCAIRSGCKIGSILFLPGLVLDNDPHSRSKLGSSEGERRLWEDPDHCFGTRRSTGDMQPHVRTCNPHGQRTSLDRQPLFCPRRASSKRAETGGSFSQTVGSNTIKRFERAELECSTIRYSRQHWTQDQNHLFV